MPDRRAAPACNADETASRSKKSVAAIPVAKFQRILIICTGNVCRSPMAEGLWRQRLGSDYTIASAGIGALAGEPATAEAVTAMQEWNIDISAHRARQIDAGIAREHELLLVMEEHHKRWLERELPFLRGRVQRLGHWNDIDIFDPYQGSAREYRQVRELIDTASEAWLRKLA